MIYSSSVLLFLGQVLDFLLFHLLMTWIFLRGNILWPFPKEKSEDAKRTLYASFQVRRICKQSIKAIVVYPYFLQEKYILFCKAIQSRWQSCGKLSVKKSSYCDYRKYNGKLTSLLQGSFEVQAENTVWLRNSSPQVMTSLLKRWKLFPWEMENTVHYWHQLRSYMILLDLDSDTLNH